MSADMGEEKDEGGYRDPRPGVERRILTKRAEVERRLGEIPAAAQASWPVELAERLETERSRAFADAEKLDALIEVERSLDTMLGVIEEARTSKPSPAPRRTVGQGLGAPSDVDLTREIQRLADKDVRVEESLPDQVSASFSREGRRLSLLVRRTRRLDQANMWGRKTKVVVSIGGTLSIRTAAEVPAIDVRPLTPFEAIMKGLGLLRTIGVKYSRFDASFRIRGDAEGARTLLDAHSCGVLLALESRSPNLRLAGHTIELEWSGELAHYVDAVLPRRAADLLIALSERTRLLPSSVSPTDGSP